MSKRSERAMTAECPRCAYDLGGEVQRWTESCPLESICPECGLSVEWRVVFAPMGAVPGWNVEHPARGLCKGVISTLVRSTRPNRFWAEPEMSSFQRGSRLVLYAVAGLAFVTVLMGLAEIGVDAYLGSLSFMSQRSLSWADLPEIVYKCMSAVLSPTGLL